MVRFYHPRIAKLAPHSLFGHTTSAEQPTFAPASPVEMGVD